VSLMQIALLMFWSFLFAPEAENRHPSQVAGIYEGAIPVKGQDARKLTLTLQQDGRAEFRDAHKTTAGDWAVNGQILQVNLTGAAVPLEWQVKGNLLTPKTWEAASYGKKGPLLRRPR